MKIHFLSLILCGSAIHGSQAPADLITQLGTRSLIILCDESEAKKTEAKALTQDLIEALNCSCIPIIVSKALYKHAWRLKNKGAISDFDLNFDAWSIYASMDSELLIFIPRQSIISKDIISSNMTFQDCLNKLNTFSSDSSKNLSDGELLLGIKLNKLLRLESIAGIISIPTSSGTRSNNTNEKILDSGTNLRKYLEQILITHADLKMVQKDLLNQWDIYLAGHGGKKYIAGMPIPFFESTLEFLNQNITTRSLFILTCHAGRHLTKPYQTALNDELRNRQFNFLIISSSAFDAPVFAGTASDSYKSYFDLLNRYFMGGKNKENDLIKAVQSFALSSLNREAIITIRHPHTEWFKITTTSNEFVLNNSIIIRTINQDEDVIRIKENTIIVEARYIPLELKIESASNSKTPLLIPTGIDYASYFFKEISMVNCTVPQFVSTLNKLKELLPHVGKLYIQKLTIKNFNPAQQKNESIVFKKIIINPGVSIALEYQNRPFTFSSDPSAPWAPGYFQDISDNAIRTLAEDFQKAKDDIRKESSLPDSMKTDIPIPILNTEFMTKS